MNAPLVVVQGDLLLPMLYPLAGMPSAVYGEEWTLTSSRPALTEYEIPFYAARFLTAYVSPLSLPNERFPYTPASLWGKFRRNDETVQTGHDPFAAASAEIASPAPEAAPFAFEPFTAPDDRLVKTPRANDRRKQVAGGAIALACAAFIAWALFGTRIGHQQPEQPAVLALNATPAAKPAADASAAMIAAAPSAVSSVVPASPAAVTTVVSGPSPAEASSRPAAIAAAAAAVPAMQTPSVAAPVIVASSATAKPSANTTAVASISGSNSAAVSARKTQPQVIAKTRPQVVAQASERDRTKIRVKAKRSTAVNREARSYEVVQRRHGHEYQGTPVYRSSGFDAPLASPARRSQPRDDMRAAAPGSSLSVAEMYSMLAHSAVLDDNSSASRQTVRATSLATPRSGSGDSSNWSSDISQRRVTDPGSQFLK